MELSRHPNDVRVRLVDMNVPWQTLRPIDKDVFLTELVIRDDKKKKQWLLGEFEGRRATRHQDGEWGTDVRDGTRTGVGERLPSAHPATTSTRCVWTQVHAGVVVICSDQPVCDRCVVFDFVARWKEGFMNMFSRTFSRL